MAFVSISLSQIRVFVDVIIPVSTLLYTINPLAYTVGCETV
jgi:hypothetical protein